MKARPMFKLIYIAKRKPGFTREAFIARWRKHGALAMSQQLWRRMARYVQASVLEPVPIEGASGDYDAIGVLWFKDDTHLTNATPSDVADVAEMAEDEFKTFSGPVEPGLLNTDEQMLKDVGAGRTTAYAFFTDDEQAQRLADRAVRNDLTHRVALNRVRRSLKPVLPYTSVVEIAALDVDDLRKALGESNLAAASPDLTLVARDFILWD
jgi:hypothetical protein